VLRCLTVSTGRPHPLCSSCSGTIDLGFVIAFELDEVGAKIFGEKLALVAELQSPRFTLVYNWKTGSLILVCTANRKFKKYTDKYLFQDLSSQNVLAFEFVDEKHAVFLDLFLSPTVDLIIYPFSKPATRGEPLHGLRRFELLKPIPHIFEAKIFSDNQQALLLSTLTGPQVPFYPARESHNRLLVLWLIVSTHRVSTEALAINISQDSLIAMLEMPLDTPNLNVPWNEWGPRYTQTWRDLGSIPFAIADSRIAWVDDDCIVVRDFNPDRVRSTTGALLPHTFTTAAAESVEDDQVEEYRESNLRFPFSSKPRYIETRVTVNYYMQEWIKNKRGFVVAQLCDDSIVLVS
jgi:hypothetical protein